MPFTLLHKEFKLCSNFELFHQEIDKLNTIYSYPKIFVDFWIKKDLHKAFTKKELVLKASKKELICVLRLIGKNSMKLRTRLVNYIENNLKLCKLKVIFQSPWKLDSFFRYEDSLNKKFRSDIAYRCTCNNCNVTNCGKIYYQFFTRAKEHLCIFNLTGKRLKSVKQSAVSDQTISSIWSSTWVCWIDFDHCDFLATDANKFRLLIKESFFSKRDQPQLN